MDYFTIEKCTGCHNCTGNLNKLELRLRQVMDEKNFNSRMAARVDSARPMHHQMFHIALAGCPNCCSQPQIKDFGVQGQVVPEVTGDCRQCGACVETCREGAISMTRHGVVIDESKCLHCGECIRICPTATLQEGDTGFRVLAGGKLGRHPRLATELASLAGEEEVARILGDCVELFLSRGRPGERLGSVMERVDKDKE